MRSPIVRRKPLTVRQDWMLRRLWYLAGHPAPIVALAAAYAEHFKSTPARAWAVLTRLEKLGVCAAWMNRRKIAVVVITGAGKRCWRAGSVIVTRAK